LRDIAFGPRGELWIIDTRGARIVRVAPEARSGEDHLRRGRGPVEFQLPDGLAVMGDGRVLVGDVLNACSARTVGSSRARASIRISGSADIAWLDGEDFAAVPHAFQPGIHWSAHRGRIALVDETDYDMADRGGRYAACSPEHPARMPPLAHAVRPHCCAASTPVWRP
jgi:hypothetical protein